MNSTQRPKQRDVINAKRRGTSGMPVENDLKTFVALKGIDGQIPYFIQFQKKQIHHIVKSDGHKKTLCGIHLRDPQAKVIATTELYTEFICSRCIKRIDKKIGKLKAIP